VRSSTPLVARFLGAPREEPDSLEARKLALCSAAHSRLGDVYGAVVTAGNVTTTLARGDTLALAFAQPPLLGDRVRDYFLLSRGVYTTNLPARQVPTEPQTAYRLYPNQPNPFRAVTEFRFDLPQRSHVQLEVFDVHGRRMRVLAAREFAPGQHSLDWDRGDATGRAVAPGVYLYRIRTRGFVEQRKLVVLP
jgi:hypothetical protein